MAICYKINILAVLFGKLADGNINKECAGAGTLISLPALLPYSLTCIVFAPEAEYLLLILGQQMSRMQSGKGGSGSFRSSFQEEARRRYRQRMQEEYEEEMERVVWSSVIILWIEFSA